MKHFMMKESQLVPEMSIVESELEESIKSKSRVVEDWKLSYNECNQANYTKFGVKVAASGSMKTNEKART